jgi:murein DD-endopeptidase MepM/ murein hydrolase activator NlpD
MVFFPWPEGEREILTSDYHQHGAFDFVNFTSPEAAVSAVAEGTVLLSDHSHPDDFNVYPACNKSSFLDLGNFVLLQHGPHTFLLYAHLSHDDPAPVKPGQEVKAGTRIGRQGNTGCSDGAHLHFAVVDIQLFPEPAFIPVPKSSWGFYEVNGSNSLVLNTQYISGNMPAGTGDGQEKK